VKHLTQGQFDALVSFIFNIGIAAFQSSTMRKILSNTNAFEKAAKEFDRWVYSKVNGKKEKLSGLVKRRNTEKELFLNGK
jgi:lysozyme